MTIKRIVKKFFRYKIATICMVTSFVIAYFCILYGSKIMAIVNQENKNANKYRYDYECNITIRTDQKNLDLIYLSRTKEVNSNISCLDIYYDHEKIGGPADIIISNHEEQVYPLVEGRYPNKNELKSKEKVVVLGIGYKSGVYKNQDDFNYILINGEEYKVTGFISDKETVIYDYKSLLYYDCLGKNLLKRIRDISQSMIGVNILLQSNRQSVENDRIELIKKYSDNKVIYTFGIPDHRFATDILNPNITKTLLLIYAFCIINCIIMEEFWIVQRFQEMTIRKTFGFTNLSIFKLLYKEVVMKSIVGVIIATFLNLFLNFFIKDIIHIGINDVNLYLVITLLFVLITSFFIIIYPMYKIIKEKSYQTLMRKEMF